MSLTSGTYKLQLRIQNVIPSPYYIDSSSKLLIRSPLYHKPHHTYLRVCSQILILLIFFPITIFRLGWLFFHWSSYTIQHFDQTIFYGAVCCLIFIVLSVYHMHFSQMADFIYLINQTIKLGANFKSALQEKSKFSKNFYPKEQLIYTFSIINLEVTTTFIVAPFFLSHLHLQMVFGNYLFVKVCEAFLFGFTITYGAFSNLPIILFSIVYFENLNLYTQNMSTTHHLDCSVHPRLRFTICYKRFRCTQIVLKLGNLVFNLYLSVLTFVGILLASCSGYVTFKMFKLLNILIYIAFPWLLCGTFVTALLLTFLASTSIKHSRNFQTYWMRQPLGRECKKRLYACKPMGFNLGPYGACTTKLGLNICDDIIHNTVTIILLGVI